MSCKNNNYRLRDGCWNCAKSIVQNRQDEPLIFCGLDGSKMPLRPKVLADKREYTRQLDKWIEWRQQRQVCDYGYCDEWVNKVINPD